MQDITVWSRETLCLFPLTLLKQREDLFAWLLFFCGPKEALNADIVAHFLLVSKLNFSLRVHAPDRTIGPQKWIQLSNVLLFNMKLNWKDMNKYCNTSLDNRMPCSKGRVHQCLTQFHPNQIPVLPLLLLFLHLSLRQVFSGELEKSGGVFTQCFLAFR